MGRERREEKCIQGFDGKICGDLNVDGGIILQEVLGRTNRLLSFDTTRTA
jgi:hypothetical protein